ncbi:MAG: hypothetical protein MUO85_05125 [candidate division Zixibacteria bacterium]|nr:hypothetical protein [candidate division Zixibacteria bacterium]
MKIEIKEMPRASEGDVIEIEGNVIRALKPSEGEYGWSQLVIIKDPTGEQGAWLKLDSEGDKVSKGITLKVKGKVSKEYKDSKGVMKRSINNCTFESDKKGEVSQASQEGSTGGSTGGNGSRDDYWSKKFEWDKKVHFSIVRECAIKAVTELAKVDPSKGNFFIKVNTEKDFFEFAEKITDYICKRITIEDIVKEFGGTTKEERIEKAREAVGETEFRPATIPQKNKIFGYRDEKGWHKGMIESRFITKEEIREIGSPEKLSVERASELLSWWWDTDDKIGERTKREIEAQGQEDEPREVVDTIKKSLLKKEPIVKGDKTSLAKDVLVDEVSALRRENFLSDDEKFEKEMGYSSNLEELSEKDLLLLKEILKHWNPKSWDKKEVNPDDVPF